MKTRSAVGRRLRGGRAARGARLRRGDWPDWRGPHRDGISDETGLVSTWSKAGENLVWKAEPRRRTSPLGRRPSSSTAGSASAAAPASALLRQEMVACFDAGTGKKLWERRFPVYNTTVPFSRVGWASLAGDPETGYVFAQNVDGQLVALDRAGKTVWQRRLGEELGRGSGYGGRTLVPFVDEDRVMVGVVGAGWGDMAGPRQRYVAFDKRTGAVRWVVDPGRGPVRGRQQQREPDRRRRRRAAPDGRRGAPTAGSTPSTRARASPSGSSTSASAASTARPSSRATSSTRPTARRTWTPRA